MKNIFKLFLLSVLVFTVSCENENDPRFQDNPETGWIQFPSSSTTVAVTPRTSTISIPVDFTAPINLSSLQVNYTISPVVGDPNDVVTGIGTSLTIEANTNRNSIDLTPVDDAVQQLIDGGDVEFDITLTSANRGVSVGLADGSATVTHRVILLCGGEPIPGAYRVEMQDSWGDGWQTVGDGGPGLQVLLTDVSGNESTLEVGMCSTFGDPSGTFLGGSGCVDGDGFTATDFINIPAGTVDAVWIAPADRFGEISFQIYNPNGVLLHDSGAPGAQPEGEITSISYCI
jgi:hypothetical protein